MHVTIVHIHVKMAHLEEFIAATQENHLASIKEPENLRFDVLQLPEELARFVLYEAYETANGAAAHKLTPHYLKWRDTVTDWMAEPRQGITYLGLLPSKENQ
ncbi:antibiotic biosynthesis monooxygenase [Sulfurirhabdus autotrophica]|uniref:Autoinducer 2-degrading protein n=1 Tax=Sulfurirhabdus autotrophica TaxID=1706046 RepID=A0A4R3XRB5_9PROT|nr:antibiotic biosynthesis monooxygenase [Sulfurirhabdus autotrophica]TCV79014.1 autoinducer 2-degrading protein [Sulfurirhabdus autotrophica]